MAGRRMWRYWSMCARMSSRGPAGILTSCIEAPWQSRRQQGRWVREQEGSQLGRCRWG
jgi:hypothetical protein